MIFQGPGLPVDGVELPDDELARVLKAHAQDRTMRRSRFQARPWLQVVDALQVSAGAQIRARSLPPARLVSLNEWAGARGVPVSTARRWATTGRLESARKQAGTWLVEATEDRPEGGSDGKAG